VVSSKKLNPYNLPPTNNKNPLVFCTLEVKLMQYKGVDITWLGHDGFKLKGDNKVVYLDPYKIQDSEKADLILISHDHFDHCSVEDLQKIVSPSTVIITVPDCQSKVMQLKAKDVFLMRPGERKIVEGVALETVHAYNINKFRAPGIPFHPKENEYLGFIINLGDTRVYHAGDTDCIPEMQNVQHIDVALLPVSGTYVMTAEEAVQAVNMIKPQLVIPMHYGSVVGTEEDAQRFKELVSVPVEILPLH
jgi:L-ascorbate metabolism protein UlaG (beta-lactamase superfamily)